MEERLFSAIEDEDYRLAQDLVLRGIDINNLIRDGISILHLISGHEGCKASKLLVLCLERGADPNVRSEEGMTPVHIAALWSRLQNLKILISHGGDPDELDNEGSDALDYACLSSERHADTCIKFLLEFEHSRGVQKAGSNVSHSDRKKLDSVSSEHKTAAEDCRNSAAVVCERQPLEDFQETSILISKSPKRITNAGSYQTHQEKYFSDRTQLNDGWNCHKYSATCTRSSDSDNDDEMAESFYTAVGDNSDIDCRLHTTVFVDELSKSNYLTADDTVVTFPKLHPWTVKNRPIDLDDTVVIGGLETLDISDECESSFSDSNNNVAIEEQDDPDLEESNCQSENNYSCLEEEELDDDKDSVFTDITIIYDWKEFSVVEEPCADDTVVIPDRCRKLSDIELREQLKSFGEVPGPITMATRQVYLRRLARLYSGSAPSKDTKYGDYFPELRAQLEGRADTPELSLAEESMCEEFGQKKSWREGTEKSSLNYLLLDPRVTQNLPARAKKMSAEDIFRFFISAVFYVGKGKRSRPYAHLYEALQSSKTNPKLQQIQDIWSAGLGVVSLHIFQSVIPVEAYTREACMIDALGLSRLTNKKRGDYYGRAKWWPQKKKREMGVYLLKRALKIFLSEGERQIKPGDLRATHSS